MFLYSNIQPLDCPQTSNIRVSKYQADRGGNCKSNKLAQDRLHPVWLPRDFLQNPLPGLEGVKQILKLTDIWTIVWMVIGEKRKKSLGRVNIGGDNRTEAAVLSTTDGSIRLNGFQHWRGWKVNPVRALKYGRNYLLSCEIWWYFLGVGVRDFCWPWRQKKGAGRESICGLVRWESLSQCLIEMER